MGLKSKEEENDWNGKREREVLWMTNKRNRNKTNEK